MRKLDINSTGDLVYNNLLSYKYNLPWQCKEYLDLFSLSTKAALEYYGRSGNNVFKQEVYRISALKGIWILMHQESPVIALETSFALIRCMRKIIIPYITDIVKFRVEG